MMPESHVVKTTCDLDVSRSPFRGCVTTSQGSPWLAKLTMQRCIEMAVAVLFLDTSFRRRRLN